MSKVEEFYASTTPWQAELAELRRIALDCGLEETWKWRAPTYMDEGRNVAFIGHTKAGAVLSFLKGALLADPEGHLQSAGPNTRSAKLLRFPDVATIREQEAVIRAFIAQAVAAERAGLVVEKPAETPEYCAELQARMAEDEGFRVAFEALTPGRRRMYHIHFSQPKNAATRVSRIEQCTARILVGKGLRDCICGKSKRMPNCDGSHKDCP